MIASFSASSQPLHGSRAFSRADSLRGSIGVERAWWDVLHYDVSVRPDFATKSIRGTTIIGFIAKDSGLRMQIDLQQPLVVDSVTADVSKFQSGNFTVVDQRANTEREGNVLWVDLPQPLKAGETSTIRITYHGVPREAVHPPWDGGWIWKTDAEGNPWMSVACQGLGASVWYPCKDTQSDEPDDGASLHITVTDTLQAIGNGRLRDVVKNADGTSTWNWKVTQPINTYNLVPYIGKYVHFGEAFNGVSGKLDCDYWVLAYNETKAREQFKQVAPMLTCFEDWFGPYPFYQDGYKLVESPHLGMEHQSAVAYGNQYKNGYLGMDLSGTGHGLKWDFIIIHESGHEWFGNSITTADIADMWVHEGITQYSEAIFTECQQGTAAGAEYVIGLRKKIENKKSIIGPYGVNQEGHGDMYPKGANLMHMIRHIIGDSTFKAMMLEMNKRFYHKITSSDEIIRFMSEFSGQQLNDIAFQYLKMTDIPCLEWGLRHGKLLARFTHCHPLFKMPIGFLIDGTPCLVQVTTDWREVSCDASNSKKIEVDQDWYCTSKQVKAPKLKARRHPTSSLFSAPSR
ncbi:MAG: M1 family metallopeptidase [Flavobacteriales bacterium]|nr:M1 family metallopeptidase [Flavobacteriales bacterium]